MPKGTLYCHHDGNYEVIQLGTIVDNVVIDELSLFYPCFSIWSLDLIYGSKWVDKLNDWGM